jgi:hypothetical protein
MKVNNEEIITKRARKFVELSTEKEITEYAIKWVNFQYRLDELKDFIDEIRNNIILTKDIESANGLFSGVVGNDSLELENSLRDNFLNDYWWC